MLKNVLESLGLTDKEIAIYLALLPIGSAPASALGNRTGINRSTAQYICQQLTKKGIVKSLAKNNTFIYTPESPDKLLYLIEQEKHLLEEKTNQTHRIIGELKAMINPLAVLPKVKFFEGVDGLIEMAEDIFNYEVLFGALQISEDIHPEMINYINNVYTPKRAKLKNRAFMLFNDNELTQEYHKNDLKVNRTSLFLPTKDFPFEACCHVYGNKVAFYSYRKNDLSGVMIENQYINHTMFALFKAAWDFARSLKINAKYKNTSI